MQKNFSLMHNMQIPPENVYSGVVIEKNFDEEIDNLSKNYEIHKLQQVKDFIKRNVELIDYIDAITPIINNHFPNYNKCITFCQDPEFDELDDIIIYINSYKSEFDDDWKKLDELEKELFYISEFSTKIKRLISLDLWLI